MYLNQDDCWFMNVLWFSSDFIFYFVNAIFSNTKLKVCVQLILIRTTHYVSVDHRNDRDKLSVRVFHKNTSQTTQFSCNFIWHCATVPFRWDKAVSVMSTVLAPLCFNPSAITLTRVCVECSNISILRSISNVCRMIKCYINCWWINSCNRIFRTLPLKGCMNVPPSPQTYWPSSTFF